jgi:hypothetical protein
MPSHKNPHEQPLVEEMQIMMLSWMWHTLNMQASFVPFCLAPSLVKINPQMLEEQPAEHALQPRKKLWLPPARLLLSAERETPSDVREEQRR